MGAEMDESDCFKTYSSWSRMSFKGNKVWAATTADGLPMEKNGKTLIKYNLKQDYEYWIKKENLLPESCAVPSKKNSAPGKKNSAPDKKKKNPASGKRKENTDILIPDNAITIFTDGASSGNPGPSGIGVVLSHGKHKKEISESIGNSTNNIAELTAIERALSQLKRFDLPVRLFTDSGYSLGVLTQGWKASRNRELVVNIKEVMLKFDDLKLIKIKGHAGFEGNERADKLATKAIKK